MKEIYGLFIMIGIIMIVGGFFLYKHPDIMWKLSLARRWYLKDGEPTELYYSSRRLGAVFYIIFGIVMIILSISMSVTEARGYVLEIDGEELKIPCTYADMEALGYQIDPAEEIRTLRATGSNNKESSTYIVRNAEGKEIKITIENRGDEDRIATECELIAIYVSKENGPRIELPNGVRIGMTESEIKSIMGKGTPRGVASSAAEYMETVSFDTYKINVVYEGSFMSGKIISIRVEDLIY